VVFTSTRNGDVPHLFRVDRDGSNLKQLTKTPAFFDAPSASPDGKWVVYSSIDRILMRIPATGGEGKSFGGLAAGEPVRVATGIHHTSDGRFIGLVTYGKRPDGLQENRPGILSSEGGAPTLFPFEIRGPIYKFRPEEQSATFLRNVDGVWNLWRQPLPDGEPQQITKFTSGRIQSYAWGPGGTLYLGRGEESSDVVLISDFR
jgi:Tol biopolymer transport system component